MMAKVQSQVLWISILSSTLVLADSLRCSLVSIGVTAVFPGDTDYASTIAPFNLRFAFQPAAITFPISSEEVSEVVKVGVSENLKVVARSGGHSYIANSLGGRDGVLVVDLKNLTKIAVDTLKGTAVIETGNRLGDIALALNDAGRAIPHGTCPDVGIGGHSGYGGSGYTSRMWGLTLDAVRSINMVLANGSIVTASNEKNPDLFWAMRGAAGSFGITTSIEFATYPVPPSATAFTYRWDLSVADACKGLSAFQSFVQTDIPAEFGVNLAVFPGSAAGRVSFFMIGGWYKDPSGLNATIAPLLSQFPNSTHTTLDTGSYIHNLLAMAKHTGSPSLSNTTLEPVAFYDKSIMTPASSPMSPRAITAFINYFANEAFSSKMRSQCILELYGGPNSAVNAVEQYATAFVHRSSMFTIECIAVTPNTKPLASYPEDGYTFLDRMMDTIISNSPADWNYGAYPNYVEDRLQDWRFRYYGDYYPLLQSLKAKYDPKDVFSFPVGIEAIGDGGAKIQHPFVH